MFTVYTYVYTQTHTLIHIHKHTRGDSLVIGSSGHFVLFFYILIIKFDND